MRRIAVLTAVVMMLSVPGALADEVDESEEVNERSLRKIELIADFASGGTSTEVAIAEATDLRTAGVGWGAMLKVYKLAAAMDVSASELFVEISADGDFDFGELKKALTDEQRASFEEMPKNLGTLMVAEKKAEIEAKKAEKRAEREARKAEKKAEREERKAAKGTDSEENSDNDGS